MDQVWTDRASINKRQSMAGPAILFTLTKITARTNQIVEITGGNHSQFAHYHYQLLDGDATIPREDQQAQTRKEIMAMLKQGD